MRNRTLLLLLLLLLLFLPKLKTHPAGRGNIVALKDGTVSYSLARSPLRLPGSADLNTYINIYT